jgi:hypothetical protein
MLSGGTRSTSASACFSASRIVILSAAKDLLFGVISGLPTIEPELEKSRFQPGAFQAFA